MSSAVPIIPYSPTDAEALVSKLGLPGTIAYIIYQQVGAGTALASSTSATSIFNGAPALGPNGATSLGSRTLPPNYLQDRSNYINTVTQYSGVQLNTPIAGGLVKLHAAGVMGTTSTPTLTISAGFTIASTYTAYTTSGAVSTVACTSPCDWTLDVDFNIIVLGAAATASIYAGGTFQYFSGSNATLQTIPLAHTITTATLVTTGSLILDAQFTWGTSSSSNTITTDTAYVEVLN